MKDTHKFGSCVHSYLNQINFNILSIKRRRHTEVHVSQRLVTLGVMESGKYGKSMDDAEVGSPTFLFHEALRSFCEFPPCLKIRKLGVIQKSQGQSYQCVMKHWRIVRSLGRSLGAWYTERTVHVPQEKCRHDTKTPRSGEFEKEV